MNKYSELIDKYFGNEMGLAWRKEFERQLESDMELKAEFDQQAEIVKGIESYAIKNELQLGLKRKARKIKTGRWLAAITITGLLVLTALTLKEEAVPEQRPVVLAPEPAPFKEESRSSALVAPDNTKPLREASPERRKKEPGLSFVWSQAKGKNLPQSVAAGPLAGTEKKLPAAAQNQAEKPAVFGSNRQSNGRMDWSNLGSPSQGRVLADSLAMEAYSKYLQDTVKNAGLIVRDKKLADSLYRSFRRSEAAREFLGKDTAGVVFLAIVEKPRRATGAALFRQNCASCHSLGTQKLKGPGLENVMNRVPGGDWVFNYILNSQRVIGSGNAYANKIYEEHGRQVMTAFEGKLSESDIRSIIEFLRTAQADK